MRASAWTTEELAHVTRESTCDREPDKAVIAIDDIRARCVGMRLELDLHIGDDKAGQLDTELDHHVVHHERLVVIDVVEPGR